MNDYAPATPWYLGEDGLNYFRQIGHITLAAGPVGNRFWASSDGQYVRDHFDTLEDAQKAADELYDEQLEWLWSRL